MIEKHFHSDESIVRERNKTGEPLVTIAGATSSKIKGRFDMICPTATMKLAEICEEGSEVHGDYNWANTKDPQGFKRDRINHAMRHLELYRAGDKSENHLAKAFWGLMAALHFDNDCECHKQHLSLLRGKTNGV